MLNVALSVVLAVGTAQAQQEPQPIVLPDKSWVYMPENAVTAGWSVSVGNEKRVRLSIDGVVFEAARIRFKANGLLYEYGHDDNGRVMLSAHSSRKTLP